MARTAKKERTTEPRNLQMLSVYMPAEIVELVENEARKEGRRAGNMGRRLIEEALEKRGIVLPELVTA